jgi:hypothetical protein
MAVGPMQFGTANNAGPDQTTLTSTVPLNPTNIPTGTLMVRNTGTGSAVVGEQTGTGARPAVEGANAAGIGVSGDSETGTGVAGGSDLGDGVAGFSSRRNGVQGISSSRAASGVYGENLSGGGFGIAGRSNVPPPPPFPFPSPVGAAVLGDNTAGGTAGAFNGRVSVTGFLSKLGGGFLIDHPLDPANSYLYHSFVESPDMMNVYNGEVTTDAEGNAAVELPGYFEALNRGFQYQLTVVGQFAQAIVAEEIRGNRFSIKTDKPDVKVSWQVTGIRQDAWANAHRAEAEVDKPEGERGKYLAPSEHGRPAEAGTYYVAPSASEGGAEDSR